MEGAQLDATCKECFGGASICENSFLHAVFSSLNDLLNDFHCFFSVFQLGQSVYHKPPEACCSFLPKPGMTACLGSKWL